MGNQATVHQLHEGQKAMPSQNGYVNLWRDIQKQPWYRSPEHVAVFMHILTSATHKPHNIDYRGVQVNLMPGQFITTYEKLGQTFGIESKSKVRRIIEKFVSLGQVSKLNLKQGNVNTALILTIRNWNKWQKSDTPPDTPSDTSKVAYLKGCEGHADTPSDTPPDTLNNNDLNNKKEHAGSATPQADFTQLRKNAFEHFWKTWSSCKKLVGVTNQAPKQKTYDNNFAKLFPDSYIKRIGVEAFKAEINAICRFAALAHQDIADADEQNKESDYFNHRKMWPAKFLGNRQWRDEA